MNKSRARSEDCRFIGVGIVLATYRERTIAIDRGSQKKNTRHQEPNTTARKHAQNTAQASDVSICLKARTILLQPVCAMYNRNFHHCRVKKKFEKVWCLVLWCYGLKRIRVLVGLLKLSESDFFQ